METVVSGHGQSGFGFEESVFDPLGLEDLVDHVGRTGQSLLDVTAGIGGHRQHVAVKAPHGVLVGAGGDHRVVERLERRVLHLYEASGPASRLSVDGHHQGQDVPQVGGASPFGDEHRPVLVDEADP